MWFWVPRPLAEPQLRLFLFPYAGGSTASLRQWPGLMPPYVETHVLQLPGRGSRFREPLVTDFPALVREVGNAMRPLLDRPFLLFGHSLGALLSFEIARFVSQWRAPAGLMVSGSRAPHLQRRREPIHNLPDHELMAELRRLNGTPQSVLDHPELMALLLPVLRADFALVDAYVYREGEALQSPILALGGLADPFVDQPGLEAWREMTTGPFASQTLPGDHFFIHAQEAQVSDALKGLIEQVSLSRR